jgi:glycosyltransferase involved in cell wall biosynthesis
MKVRLYGSTKGNTSWPRVTKGLMGGLLAIDKLASVYPIEDVDDMYECLTEGFDAPMGVYFGPPKKSSVMKNRGDHEHRLAIISANSSWLPRSMDTVAEDLTGFIGPTEWACEVLRNHTKLPVYLWRLGVSEEFCLNPDYRAGLPDKKLVFRVLHMASTWMERKSTRGLIFAWASLLLDKIIPPDSEITLVVSLPHGYALNAIEEASGGDDDIKRSFRLLPCQNLSERDTRILYQNHHVLCQPSRSEGFGLTVLEAMASGVPVVATACTGHSEFLGESTPGAVIVKHGPDALIDDGPGAMSPTVTPDAIARSLKEGYERWAELVDALVATNKEFKAEWSWENTCKKFFEDSSLRPGSSDPSIG